MSILNSSALNAVTFGSGDAGGPEVVRFSGTIYAALVGTLTTEPLVIQCRIHRPMLLNAWMFERPLRSIYSSMHATSYAMPSLKSRVAYKYHISDTEGMALNPQLNPRVIRRCRESLYGTQSLTGSFGGFGFATREAPYERTGFVSFNDRLSFTGGR